MSRETKYTAIILKKQPFGEGDEIITFFTKENGKVRALAKSVKLAKSKLQQKLQVLFVADLTLPTGKLPKVISVETQEVFAGLRENLAGLKIAFYALEVVLKFTADEQKNEPLFELLKGFLSFLNLQIPPETLNLGLAKFKILVLGVLGLDIQILNQQPSENIFFSASLGGFSQERAGDAFAVSPQVYSLFLKLKAEDFKQLPNWGKIPGLDDIQNLFSQFIEYQLERKVKSEKYLRQEGMV